MSRHFDLEEAERRLRAGNDDAFKAAFAKADTEEDRRLVELQLWLAEARMTCMIAGLRAANEQADPANFLEAIGATVGNILVNAAAGSPFPNSFGTGIAIRAMMEVLNGHRDGQAPEGCHVGVTSISPMTSGTA